MATIISMPKFKKYRTKCNNCKCIFEFDAAEISRGGASGKKLIFCPNCRELIYYNFFTWKKVIDDN